MSGAQNAKVLSHQLSNGLYVSGRPDQYKEKTPTMSSTVMPYTGGDVKRSGELGKMFDIQVETPRSKKSGPVTGGSFKSNAASNSGPLSAGSAPRSVFSTSGPGTPRQGSQRSDSGPLTGSVSRQGSMSAQPGTKSSGPILSGGTTNPSKTSGPLNLPSGLITSGPLSSGPLSSTGAPRKASGPLDASAAAVKINIVNSQAVTNLSHDSDYSFWKNFPRVIVWIVIPLFVIGLIAGGFILAVVKNAMLLIVIGSLTGAVVLLILWNAYWKDKAVLAFASNYPGMELASAKDGQIVKITGVVTCGSVPLETRYQNVGRCIYTSTGLYEYRSLHSKPANESHRRLTWGLRHRERHITDFYISDFQTGLRALVKAGYGANVNPYIDESTIIEIAPNSENIPPEFLRWLTERNLSRDDRRMRLTEGYIKEGSTLTVLGMVQRQENVLMIVPPTDPISTGCQWTRCFLPINLSGMLVSSHETSFKVDIA